MQTFFLCHLQLCLTASFWHLWPTTHNKRYFCANFTIVQVFSTLENIKIEKPIVTVGAFDGVHLGHRQVIRRLIECAKSRGGSSVVMTFWPHPSVVLNPERQFHMLSTLEEKKSLLAETGIDYLAILPFTREFSQIEYADFVSGYLVRDLNMDTLLIGYDNKMGKDGLGHFAELEKLSQKHNFNIQQLSALSSDTKPISSTSIRQLLSEGKVEEAAISLGRNYSLAGEVVKGNHIGTTLGFPTANIKPEACKFVPGNGVYAITANVLGSTYLGMLNIGMRPTIEGTSGDITIEANLFGFNGDIYGQTASVSFLGKIRDERQFGSVDELREQLQADRRYIADKYRL